MQMRRPNGLPQLSLGRYDEMTVWNGTPMRRHLVTASAIMLATCSAIASSPLSSGGNACREVDGFAALNAPGKIVLLGEMHGTKEIPAFVANITCLALRAGRPVTVALEVPRDEQTRIGTFIKSAGDDDDRAALLKGPFWNAAFQDGRRSGAMLALLDRVRQMRAHGLPVEIALIDRQAPPSTSAERDRWMAEALAAAADASPQSLIVALIGNVHTRVTRGVPWDGAYEPAGYVLRQLRPGLSVTALNVAYTGGTVWTCPTPDPLACGSRQITGRANAPTGVVLHDQIVDGHMGAYGVGELTASVPAIRGEPPQ